MKLEYLKGADNKIADTLSRLPPEKLDGQAVAELLDYARNSYKPRAETANMNIIEEGCMWIRSLEHGSKVSWEDVITRTPWMSKRLHGMTTRQEQTV